jgi:amidase
MKNLQNLNELNELGIRDLTALLTAGEISALELVDYYLGRIESIDRNGPALNSILELNPGARSDAKNIDKGKNALRGKLAGIPLLLKGNIDTGDGMSCTAGSLALAGHRPAGDAELVRLLRETGAIILGKTNLSEWANFRSTASSSGWSSQGGQTKNPYLLDRNPCGSSSGSAVAVSASLCAAAIGTETDGSILCPSSSNGIVGIKPTVGLVSRQGIIPISHSQDTAGPMARTVEDAAILLSVMMGDRASFDIGEMLGSLSGATADCGTEALRGLRLGVVRNFFGKNSAVDALMEKALGLLEAAGVLLIDTVLETKGSFDDAEFEVLLYEFSTVPNPPPLFSPNPYHI